MRSKRICLWLPTALLLLGQPAGYRPITIRDDPQHLGGEAYQLVAPDGWQVQGGIEWRTAISNPAAPWVLLTGPAGREIGALPPLTYVWNDVLIGPYFPPGSLYAGTEVHPPITDPFQCIRQVIVPRYRHQIANATIVKQELLPELVRASWQDWPLPDTRLAAGKVRFAYMDRGIAVEEDVYTLVAAINFRVGPTTTTIWIPSLIRYSKAPRGMLDSQFAVFHTVISSLRPELDWWAKLQRVQRSDAFRQKMQKNTAVDWWWQQNTAFQRLDAATRATIRNGDQIDPTLLQSYQEFLASLDRINAHWDR